MKILYQYRSGKFDAPPGHVTYFMTNCSENRMEYDTLNTYRCGSVSRCNALQLTTAKILNVGGISDCPDKLANALSENNRDYDDRHYHLPDRDSFFTEHIKSFNPKNNGCWSHTITSKSYSKDAVR
jgi:hypothetical protein